MIKTIKRGNKKSSSTKLRNTKRPYRKIRKARKTFKVVVLQNYQNKIHN